MEAGLAPMYEYSYEQGNRRHSPSSLFPLMWQVWFTVMDEYDEDMIKYLKIAKVVK